MLIFQLFRSSPCRIAIKLHDCRRAVFTKIKYKANLFYNKIEYFNATKTQQFFRPDGYQTIPSFVTNSLYLIPLLHIITLNNT